MVTDDSLCVWVRIKWEMRKSILATPLSSSLSLYIFLPWFAASVCIWMDWTKVSCSQVSQTDTGSFFSFCLWIRVTWLPQQHWRVFAVTSGNGNSTTYAWTGSLPWSAWQAINCTTSPLHLAEACTSFRAEAILMGFYVHGDTHYPTRQGDRLYPIS